MKKIMFMFAACAAISLASCKQEAAPVESETVANETEQVVEESGAEVVESAAAEVVSE